MDRVRQRCVFYLSGFDPKGASHYHAMYREEAAKQAPLNGLTLEVGKRARTPEGNAVWTLRATADGVESAVHTHYEFLRWDDVVRQHWPKGTPQLWWDVLRTTVFNLRHGSLWRMYQRSWPPAVALFMPFLLVLAQMVGAPLLALLAGVLAWSVGSPVWVATPVGVLVGAGVWWITRWLETRYAMYWMMRSYAFTREQAQGRVPDLDLRLDEHAARLVARWREAVDDEILLVGHSTGAVMAVSVLARACQLEPALARSGPRVALLTLGQWIPLLALLPQAQRFRDELEHLATTPLDWLDFSAPPDGCCFALTDPYALCSVPNPRLDFPKLLNPRFADMFEPAAYRALKRDKFQLHFQYLLAAERPTDYDYFAITAGPQALAARFADHPGVRAYRGLQPRWVRRGGT